MTLKERLKKFDLLPVITEKPETSISPEVRTICNELSKLLSAKIALIPVWFEYSRDEQKELVLNFLNAKLNSDYAGTHLTDAEKDSIVAYFLSMNYGFGSLDFLIEQKEVSKIFVKAYDNIFVELNGEVVKADTILDERQFNSLIARLQELANKKSPICSFRFNNLFVTIVSEPVSSPQLILRKLSDVCYNFEILENKQILNQDIIGFFRSSLGFGKRFLVIAPGNSGKTVLLNAFVNEAQTQNGVLLFEECELINVENKLIDRFNVGDLTVQERNMLLNAVLAYKPSCVVSDVNDIGFGLELVEKLEQNASVVVSLEADSPNDAIKACIRKLMFMGGCDENSAKLKFAKAFDFIIQLEKTDDTFILKNIHEISAKNSTVEFVERLSFASGNYKYDFPPVVPPEQKSPSKNSLQPEKKNLFSSRFAKIAN